MSKKDKALKLMVTPKNISKLIPKEVAKMEDVGTTALQTSQEFLLLVEDILLKHYNFTEDQLKEFEEKLRIQLVTLGEFERKGFSILTTRDMAVIGDIAHERHNRLRAGRAGVQLPQPHEMEKLLSQPKVGRKKIIN